MAFDSKKVINGTHGTLWVNDVEIGEVKSFQCKIEFEKEEIKMAGVMATHTKYMGYNIKGSMALHKVNSRMVKLISDSIKQGKEPRFTVIGKLADPDAEGTERIAIKNVSFDDLTLMDWEVGSVGASEHPFTATDWEVLDSI